ncbi:YdcF family protein [Pseudoalteromonas sp. SR44-8]|uniref:YdcF family protein n=1 Tax=Pseudoalteromonas sp. SR44-8 TaxID=2760933 RepID=UPI00160116A9|nr:YdcF family protein [Pseudoalteromonas sp. SR44-8]MBB1302864.1 YdcF family protein [Pseudoalteromonas sp. SR44-8]
MKNSANHAHGEYTKSYLIELGIPESAFLPVALSRFTFEDALLTKPILIAEHITEAILVSSEFHIARVHYVFSHVQPNLELTLVTAKTPLSEIKLAQLYAHERQAMQREEANVLKLLSA